MTSALGLTLAAAASGGASPSDPYFDEAVTIPLSVQLGLPAAGDLDLDGDLDVVGIALPPDGSGYPKQLAVALNDGTGAFTEGPRIKPKGKTQYYDRPALGDLNGDGDLDLIVVSYKLFQFSVMLGRSGAAFGKPIVHTLDERPTEVTMDDLDGDGDLDVAVGTHEAVRLFRHDGGGHLVEMTRVGKTNWSDETTLVDVDADGDQDVVAIAADRKIGVWLNKGSWQFGRRLDLDLPEEVNEDMTIGDFDGDGLVDIVTCYESYDVAIAYGRGNGTFRSPQTIGTFPGQRYLDSADLGGDDRAEFTVAGSSQLHVFTVSRDRTLIETTTHDLAPWGGAPIFVDFDGDGARDGLRTTSDPDDDTETLEFLRNVHD